MTAPVSLTDPNVPSCHCGDPDLDRLVDLMAAGMSQPEASRVLWGGEGEC